MLQVTWLILTKYSPLAYLGSYATPKIIYDIGSCSIFETLAFVLQSFELSPATTPQQVQNDDVDVVEGVFGI